MPLIKTDQPSTGKTIILATTALTSAWTTLCEAPYFSVPLAGDVGEYPDPSDLDRELIKGEMFISSPIMVTNRDTVNTAEVQFRIVLETSTENPALGTPEVVAVTPIVPIDKSESVQIPLQGLTLLKEDMSATYGGRLQAKAVSGTELDLYGSAVESAHADHALDGDENV